MRDNKYSLEIMEQELENKYISPEILYAFKNSIEALKKQIPELVDKNLHNVAFCPSCNGSVWQISDDSKYCFRCGQKLKWN